MQVVNNHHVEIVLGVEPARLGAQFQHGDGRRVVDENRRIGERTGSLHQAMPLVLAVDVAQPQPLRVDAGLGGQHALHKLLVGHLQAEYRHPFAVLACRGLSDGDRQ